MPRQAPEWARVPPLPQGHSNSTETQTEWFTLEEFGRRSQQPQQETDGEAIWRATLLAEGQTISSGSSASSSSDSGIGGTHGEFVGEGEYKICATSSATNAMLVCAFTCASQMIEFVIGISLK